MSKERFNQNGNYYPPDWVKEQLSNYSFKFFNDTCDYIDNKRRIEITEFKLGIHNPYSNIDYVDFEDNPHYKGWKFFDLMYKGELYRKALIRTGKTNITKAAIERELKKRCLGITN